MENIDLPFYLLRKASAQLTVANSITEQPIIVSPNSQNLELNLMLMNKGMLDAHNIFVTVKFEDQGYLQVSSTASTPLLNARSFEPIKVSLGGISKTTMDTLKTTFLYQLGGDRVGLNFLVEISHDGMTPEKQILYIPMQRSSFTNDISWPF